MPTIARRVACIELTKHGLPSDSVKGSLVELAIVDGKRVGKSLKLYKVVPGKASNYYVFTNKGWSDIYTVYETDPQRSRFVGKYQYGSLHYPCPAPAGAAQQTKLS